MKARLIAHSSTNWVGICPSGDTYPANVGPALWPVDQEIPEGWEEVELVDEPSAGTTRADRCICGDERRHHVEHRKQCLVVRDGGPCRCREFQEG